MVSSVLLPLCLVVLLNIFMCFHINFAVELKFTNLQCNVEDPSFLKYRKCNLKVIRRGVVALNVHIDLLKAVNTLEVNNGLYKKANGYKPFLYNFTFDLCKMLKGQTVNNIVANILMKFSREYSNINHTCPFTDNFIIKDMILSEDKFRLMPLPTGEYLHKFAIIINGELRTVVGAYYNRIE